MLQIVSHVPGDLPELDASVATYWAVPNFNWVGFYDAKAVTCKWSKTECDLFGAENSIYFSNLGLEQWRIMKYGVNKHCKKICEYFQGLGVLEMLVWTLSPLDGIYAEISIVNINRSLNVSTPPDLGFLPFAFLCWFNRNSCSHF